MQIDGGSGTPLSRADARTSASLEVTPPARTHCASQAGVSLGLALSVPDAYPWKPDFVACSVALIVCNQVVGPPLFKWAIKLVKEDNHGYHPKELQRDGALPALAHLGSRVQRLPQPRGGLIIGHEKDEVVLSVASKLRALRWEVVCADANLCAHPEHDARPRTMPRPKRDAAAEQRSAFNLGGLSSDVREKVRARTLSLGRAPRALMSRPRLGTRGSRRPSDAGPAGRIKGAFAWRGQVKVYRGGKALVNTYQSLPVMSSKVSADRLPSTRSHLQPSALAELCSLFPTFALSSGSP
eukprot:6090362-Pleurochrysis_carterae.AAC.1